MHHSERCQYWDWPDKFVLRRPRFDTGLSAETAVDLTDGSNLYYTRARAQMDDKNAISTTDSNELGFTYTAGNITASLFSNSVDIAKLKSAQYSSNNTLSARVQREATTGDSPQVNSLGGPAAGPQTLPVAFSGMRRTMVSSV